ncbi:MAG: hypothetical protein GC164_10000 [Phycisphaera sp.]|nr:hypothetical protein [Phycisphaera sp.]
MSPLWQKAVQILRDDRGALSVEYMLILAVIVMPLALLEPLFMKMVVTYNLRIVRIMGLPFP